MWDNLPVVLNDREVIAFVINASKTILNKRPEKVKHDKENVYISLKVASDICEQFLNHRYKSDNLRDLSND